MAEPRYRTPIPCENLNINYIDGEKKLEEGEKFISL